MQSSPILRGDKPPAPGSMMKNFQRWPSGWRKLRLDAKPWSADRLGGGWAAQALLKISSTRAAGRAQEPDDFDASARIGDLPFRKGFPLPRIDWLLASENRK